MKKVSLVFVLLVAACVGESDYSTMRSPAIDRDANKVVARLFLASQGTAAQQDVMSSNYRELRREFANLAYNAEGSALADEASTLTDAIANRRNEVELVIADGDKVAIKYRIKGDHIGNLYGIPATGQVIDIQSVAILTVIDGKVSNSWMMADEAGLLYDIGAAVPLRADGRKEHAPLVVDGRAGDEVLKDLMAQPVDSQEYINKRLVTAYKSKNPPPGIVPVTEGRVYETWLRPGFCHVSARGAALGLSKSHSFLGAVPDRLDKIALMMVDGDHVLIHFRLTGTNSESLFGLPPTNAPVDAWEVGIMGFEGDHWKTGWWFGDDLGMSIQLKAPKEFLFPDGDIAIGEAC